MSNVLQAFVVQLKIVYPNKIISRKPCFRLNILSLVKILINPIVWKKLLFERNYHTVPHSQKNIKIKFKQRKNWTTARKRTSSYFCLQELAFSST